MDENIFKNLSPAAQRVAIAEDVIEQIHLGAFTPRTRTTVYFNGNCALKAGRPLREQLPHTAGHCSACALGAALLSAVRLGNDCLMPAGYSSLEFRFAIDFLRRYFSSQQLRLIEIAFERGYGGFTPDRENRTELDAASFGWIYTEPSERMEAIMRNIISNEGEFIPLIKNQIPATIGT